MKILFVFSTLLNLGGMETLIVRLSQSLSAQGHSVSLLLTDTPEQRNAGEETLVGEVRKHARIFFAETRFALASRSLKALKAETFDILYAFESNSLVLAFLIQGEFQPQAKVVTGVYHGREYCSISPNQRFLHRLASQLMQKMPLTNILSINEAFLKEHQDWLGRDFTGAPIVPLAIDLSRFENVKRSADPRKIVSIGRITDFKTYNFTMLDTLQILKERRLTFEYHVYGTGTQFDLLKAEVSKRSMEAQVFLHGSLPYSEFGTVLESAFVFVGMGTAVIEAAACGVPSLPAIESQPLPVTYGFLHETREPWIGELVEGEPQFTLQDKIEALARLSEQDYQNREVASRNFAKGYRLDTVTRQFVAALENAQPFTFEMTPTHKFRNLIDMVKWKVLPRLGIADPTHSRFDRELTPLNKKVTSTPTPDLPTIKL